MLSLPYNHISVRARETLRQMRAAYNWDVQSSSSFSLQVQSSSFSLQVQSSSLSLQVQSSSFSLLVSRNLTIELQTRRRNVLSKMRQPDGRRSAILQGLRHERSVDQ